MVAMNDQPNSIANHSDSSLQAWLEKALVSSAQQRELLRQPEILREILNSIPHRRWLYQVARQTNDRNRALKARSLIILIMQYSNNIWRGNTAPEDYEEALARTWKWFSEHFHNYDPEKGSFVTWFNNKLGFMILDIEIERQKQSFLPEEKLIHVADPKRSYVEARIFHDQLVDLVQRDPGNALRHCYMHDHLHITSQRAMLAILQTQPISPNIPWETLACQFEVDLVSFRNFCYNTAFPRFRQFCKQHGMYHS